MAELILFFAALCIAIYNYYKMECLSDEAQAHVEVMLEFERNGTKDDRAILPMKMLEYELIVVRHRRYFRDAIWFFLIAVLLALRVHHVTLLS